jgi:GTPase SAR1 family protein
MSSLVWYYKSLKMKRTFNKKVVQCTIVGDSSVGKTSLVKKFLRADENKEDVTPTVFDNFSGKLENYLKYDLELILRWFIQQTVLTLILLKS